jgi:hypothetical protein
MRTFSVFLIALVFGLVARPLFAADPTISKVNAQESLNRTALHTAKFEATDTFKYSIWRRAASASINVEVSADFSDATHEIAIDVSNTFTPTPLSLTLTPKAAAPAPGDWALQYLGTKTEAGKKIVQLSVQIADTAAIGRYTFSAVVREAGKTTAISQVAFAKPVVILFNPWSSRDSVFLDDAKGRGEYVNEGNGLYRTEVDNRDRTWRYGQFDAITIDTLLRLLSAPDFDKPNEQMSTEQRSNPIAFSRAIAKSLDRYVQGDWVLEVFGPGETSPRAWKDSTQLFTKFGTPPVKYVRCWVYANMMTSLFRCAGLPARSVSCLQAAHERFPFNGFVDIFEIKQGPNWVQDTTKTIDRAWGFHAWTEAWMKRPDRANCDGWQAVDATYGTGPAPVKAILAKAAGDYETDSFVTAVGAPIRFWRNNKVDRTDTKSIGKKIITKKIGVAAEEDIVRNYKPAPRIPGGGPPDVIWQIPETSPAGEDVVVVAHLSNPDPLPVTIDLTVSAYAECYDQSPRGEAKPPESRTVTLAGGEPDHTETFTIPWSMYESFAAVSDHLRVDAFAVCDALDAGWPNVTYVVFDAPDLSVARTSLPVLATGEMASFDIEFRNTSAAALVGCEVTVQPLGSLDSGAPAEVIVLGSVGPDASFAWTRSFPGLAVGNGGLSVQVTSDQQAEWSAGDGVEITGCVCDLNRDDVVDDEDFVAFAQAYELLISPPADPLCDFTRDGLVDDEDFAQFVAAYDAFLCIAIPEDAR